jgi:hypothetical protein
MQTPRISLISCVQMSLYRLQRSVCQLLYRCLHTDSTPQSDILCTLVHTGSIHQSDKWWTDISIQIPQINLISCVELCSYSSTPQSDNLCTDVSIQTPHISLISCVKMCPYRLHKSVSHLEYRCHYRNSTHRFDNLWTDVSIQTPQISLTSGIQMSL